MRVSMPSFSPLVSALALLACVGAAAQTPARTAPTPATRSAAAAGPGGAATPRSARGGARPHRSGARAGSARTHAVARGREILSAAGARDICVNTPILYGGWHLLGTARSLQDLPSWQQFPLPQPELVRDQSVSVHHPHHPVRHHRLWHPDDARLPDGPASAWAGSGVDGEGRDLSARCGLAPARAMRGAAVETVAGPFEIVIEMGIVGNHVQQKKATLIAWLLVRSKAYYSAPISLISLSALSTCFICHNM